MMINMRRRSRGGLMTNAFTRKLSQFVTLNHEEIAALECLSAQPDKRPRGSDLVKQGDRPEFVQLLLDGYAYRYKTLKDGSRQIVAYLLPGDICDLHVTLLSAMDHSIGLLTDATVIPLRAAELDGMLARYTGIRRALWCATLIDEAILREWLANIGQRDALSRVGHHFCELWHRMKSIGLVSDEGEFDLPITQEQLADALGLTPVHINRTLQKLRADGLIALSRKRLTLLDPKGLAICTGFDPTYLHAETARRPVQAASSAARGIR
jgi:CRP-like cAMP-binding protein